MINTLTLNPAVDQILFLEKVEKSVTNRVREKIESIGGKGTHVSINLSGMGVQNQAFGIAYGETGRKILDMLEALDVTTRFVVREKLLSRTNYLLVEDDHTCTIIAEKGVPLTEEDLEDIFEKLRRHMKAGDYLILSGDASNSPDPFVYNRISDELRDMSLNIFLDASGETLKKGVECSPFLIKPNKDELAYLSGFPVETDEDVIRGIKALDGFDIDNIAVSLGGDGSITRFGKEFYRVRPPVVEVINTIGCGDCFLSGIVRGISAGWPHDKTLRFATAISAATAASPLSVGYDKLYADSLIAAVSVERIM
jgi:1-phosphofructokinase family hexose kinase